jgi:hypothetical protein
MFTATRGYLLFSQFVPSIVLLGLRSMNGRERALFLTWDVRCRHRVCLTLSAHRILEQPVDSNVFSKAAYFADNRLTARWIEERSANQWSDGVSLAVVLLMSLGLWAAAWEVIASLSSVLL